ncbi:hypothetical protein GQ600_6274 [Phytophthora cactorum]|nr:hypothetical protein GQ600_6274 [Phytophthora cactorum]
MPELENSSPPERPKNRRTSKKQKQEVVKQEEAATSASHLTSKDHLAAVVAKIRADDVVSGKADAKYLSYEKKDEYRRGGGGRRRRGRRGKDETKEQDSSTDDENENGKFDLNEEDVYIVEAILCVKEGRTIMSAGRRQKELLIDMFRERERAKRACQYQIKEAHERREVINVTTQQKDVLYMIQWINQETPVWESRSTLPIKTQVWLDKVLGAPAVKKRRETKVVKQYIYQ